MSASVQTTQTGKRAMTRSTSAREWHWYVYFKAYGFRVSISNTSARSLLTHSMRHFANSTKLEGPASGIARDEHIAALPKRLQHNAMRLPLPLLRLEVRLALVGELDGRLRVGDQQRRAADLPQAGRSASHHEALPPAKARRVHDLLDSVPQMPEGTAKEAATDPGADQRVGHPVEAHLQALVVLQGLDALDGVIHVIQSEQPVDAAFVLLAQEGVVERHLPKLRRWEGGIDPGRAAQAMRNREGQGADVVEVAAADQHQGDRRQHLLQALQTGQLEGRRPAAVQQHAHGASRALQLQHAAGWPTTLSVDALHTTLHPQASFPSSVSRSFLPSVDSASVLSFKELLVRPLSLLLLLGA
eukprot:scaffold247_cov274-Pinguiococcus_pyrenoidosus.AAC.17